MRPLGTGTLVPPVTGHTGLQPTGQVRAAPSPLGAAQDAGQGLGIVLIGALGAVPLGLGSITLDPRRLGLARLWRWLRDLQVVVAHGDVEGAELVGEAPHGVCPVVVGQHGAAHQGWQGVGRGGRVAGGGARGHLPRPGPGRAADGADRGPGVIIVGAGGAHPLARVVSVRQRERGAGRVTGLPLPARQLVDI